MNDRPPRETSPPGFPRDGAGRPARGGDRRRTPDGRITFVNAAAEALFGYAAAELVGQPITMLVPRQPERRVDPVQVAGPLGGRAGRRSSRGSST